MPAASTESTPSRWASRPVCRTSGSSMASVPLDRIHRGRGASRASAAATSGKGASVRYAPCSRARSPDPSSIPSAASAKSSACAVTAAKSARGAAGEIIKLVSQVYSSCFVRHSCESAVPRPGASVSASAVTEWTSNSVPYASNTSASTSREPRGSVMRASREECAPGPVMPMRRNRQKRGVTLARNPLVHVVGGIGFEPTTPAV